MTRGFFTFEENNRITKAVELSGSAYLQDGYGEEIVEAYKNGKEESYFKSLYKQMNSEQKRNYRKFGPVGTGKQKRLYLITYIPTMGM